MNGLNRNAGILLIGLALLGTACGPDDEGIAYGTELDVAVVQEWQQDPLFGGWDYLDGNTSFANCGPIYFFDNAEIYQQLCPIFGPTAYRWYRYDSETIVVERDRQDPLLVRVELSNDDHSLTLAWNNQWAAFRRL